MLDKIPRESSFNSDLAKDCIKQEISKNKNDKDNNKKSSFGEQQRKTNELQMK